MATSIGINWDLTVGFCFFKSFVLENSIGGIELKFCPSDQTPGRARERILWNLRRSDSFAVNGKKSVLSSAVVEKWQCSRSVFESFIPQNWLKVGKRRTGIGFRRFQWEGWLEKVRSVERSGIIEKWTPSRSCKTGHKHTIVYFGSAWKSNLPIASCVGEKSLHRFQLISMGRNWMVYSNSKTHFLLGTRRKVTKSQMPTATFYRAFWILVVVVQHL